MTARPRRPRCGSLGPEADDTHRAAIGAAARHLDELRQGYLNPPEWTCEEVLEFPGSADGPLRPRRRRPLPAMGSS